MHEKEYRGVSRIAAEYFRALMSMLIRYRHHLRGTYEIIPENPEGTFTIRVSSREAYDLMQKVFSAENG